MAQKNDYHDGKLAKYQITALEEITDWRWEKIKFQWLNQYSRLVGYVTANDRFPTVEDGTLYEWLALQRDRYLSQRINKTYLELLERLKEWVVYCDPPE